MGRVKVVFRRIEDNANRNANFLKRRDRIIKKAFELAVLCDNDVAMLMFAPNGRLICFPCSQRLEDVLMRYASLPNYCRAGTCKSVPNEEEILDRLREIQRNREIAARLARIEELQREVSRLSQQLELVEARLRNYEPDPDTITSIKQAEWCERFLTDALRRINEIKEELFRNHLSSQGQEFVQVSLDGQDGTLVPFKVDQVALLPEITLHPINTSMEFNTLIRASDGLIDKNIDEGSIKHVGPQALEYCQVNRQVDENSLPWHQDYTSTELMAMCTTPTFPEMEAVMNEDMLAGMPSQKEEGGPGADDDVGGAA